jgi:hypothetical protein
MKYPSKYSNGKEVSAAQYIAEMICERIAKKNKKDLHYRFWISNEWEKEYKGQIGAAHKLLKQYDFKDIVKGLNSASGSKIYSLRAPHLPDIIERTKKINDNKPTVEPKTIQRNLLDKGKTEVKTKNSIIDKLKEIDDGITR